jgi:hypothetical protein
MPVNDALYTVKTSGKESIGHPLVDAGHKLLPSVTRVFSASRDLYVYLEAYEQYATPAHPLVAYVTLYRDGSKAFESSSLAARDALDRTSNAVPIRVTMPLAGVSPGRYDCQVTVIDPAGRRAAFWQAPIAIVP